MTVKRLNVVHMGSTWYIRSRTRHYLTGPTPVFLYEPMTFKSVQGANYHIPDDVLWVIFLSVASDLDVDISERLSETIRNTHVCHEWRNIILDSPSIWGRLLWVNNNEHSLKWLPVSLERSRSSSLWIEGVMFTGGRGEYGDSAEFFYKMLDESWTRIERLKVRVYGQAKPAYYGSTRQIRSVLQRPAPMLRTFILDNRTMFMDVDEEDTSCKQLLPLFADSALSLHEFGTNLGPFVNLTCLSNLRTLYTSRRSTFTSTPCQLLDILATAPFLESLAVYHDIIEETVGSTKLRPLPGVNLPFLSKLVLHTTARNCMDLLGSIKPSSSGCLVACNATIDPWDTNLESTLKDLRSAFKKIMEDHVRLAHSNRSNSKNRPLKSLELHITDSLILLNDACSILPGNENSFKLSLSWQSWVPTAPHAYPAWFFSTICSLFSFEQLKNVAQLRLALFDEDTIIDYLVPQYRPLLQSFSSVKYLETDLISFNFLYQAIQPPSSNNVAGCGSDGCDIPRPILPNLAVLRLCEHPHRSQSQMTKISKTIDNIIAYVRSRNSDAEGNPIKVLDLTFDVEEKNIGRLLESLEAMNLGGLHVCWWQDEKAGFRVVG